LFKLTKIKKDNSVLYIRLYRSIHVIYSYTMSFVFRNLVIKGNNITMRCYAFGKQCR